MQRARKRAQKILRQLKKRFLSKKTATRPVNWPRCISSVGVYHRRHAMVGNGCRRCGKLKNWTEKRIIKNADNRRTA